MVEINKSLKTDYPVLLMLIPIEKRGSKEGVAFSLYFKR